MTSAPPNPWRTPSVILATGLCIGASPWAPGTLGTLWGIPITMALAGISSLAIRIVVIAILVIVGIPICGAAAKALGRKDPGAVVWDEFATVPIVFLFVPVSLWWNPWALAVGFLLHRVFDISKFPPVNYFERLPGGWGIMMDDVAAALYAAACLWGVWKFGFL